MFRCVMQWYKQQRFDNRGSFIAGPSTHNQRIERLWRDVFRWVCHFYYYVFYAMEYSGVLDVSLPKRQRKLRINLG